MDAEYEEVHPVRLLTACAVLPCKGGSASNRPFILLQIFGEAVGGDSPPPQTTSYQAQAPHSTASEALAPPPGQLSFLAAIAACKAHLASSVTAVYIDVLTGAPGQDDADDFLLALDQPTQRGSDSGAAAANEASPMPKLAESAVSTGQA